jgi:hypothetical protein
MSGEFPRKQYIQIRRLPPARTFYGHQLGLTIAFFLTGLTLVLDILNPAGSPFVRIGLVLLFFWGTRVGGLFLTVATVAAIVGFFISLSPTWQDVFTACQIYGAGYLAGRVFGEIYNALVFFFITNFERYKTGISFVYDPDSKVNVIKSPLVAEMHALSGLGRKQLQAELLYDTSLPEEERPEAPYTILFVANPYLQTNDGHFEHDPILRDRSLFLRSVDRALNSLASDIVVGMDAIWDRVRIVTLFDAELMHRAPAKEYALAGQGKLNIDDTLIDNLLSPTEFHGTAFGEYFESAQDTRRQKIPFKDVDVIMALSASKEFTRSSAIFTDFPEVERGDAPMEDGIPFNVAVPYIDQSWNCVHEFRASTPGRAAINVLTARTKTYIHEFAHAMSSAVNGAIMDEYADDFAAVGATNEEAENAGRENIATIKAPLIINRLEQNWPTPNPFYPIPPIFALYNGVEFYSDQYHPSDDGRWFGYFPNRANPYVPCTMDASGMHHTFDRLIRAFMYDRIMAKMRREAVRAGEKVEKGARKKEKG